MQTQGVLEENEVLLLRRMLGYGGDRDRIAHYTEKEILGTLNRVLKDKKKYYDELEENIKDNKEELGILCKEKGFLINVRNKILIRTGEIENEKKQKEKYEAEKPKWWD